MKIAEKRSGVRPEVRRGGWWGRVLMVWLILHMGYTPALYGRPASTAHKRLAQQVAPSGSPPPALPSSATERVLALSLAEAIRLALQNNLDIERGRLDPQVAHTQVERARAVFDPSAALTTRLAQTKPLPQNKALQVDSETGAEIGHPVHGRDDDRERGVVRHAA